MFQDITHGGKGALRRFRITNLICLHLLLNCSDLVAQAASPSSRTTEFEAVDDERGPDTPKMGNVRRNTGSHVWTNEVVVKTSNDAQLLLSHQTVEGAETSGSISRGKFEGSANGNKAVDFALPVDATVGARHSTYDNGLPLPEERHQGSGQNQQKSEGSPTNVRWSNQQMPYNDVTEADGLFGTDPVATKLGGDAMQLRGRRGLPQIKVIDLDFALWTRGLPPNKQASTAQLGRPSKQQRRHLDTDVREKDITENQPSSKFDVGNEHTWYPEPTTQVLSPTPTPSSEENQQGDAEDDQQRVHDGETSNGKSGGGHESPDGNRKDGDKSNHQAYVRQKRQGNDQLSSKPIGVIEQNGKMVSFKVDGTTEAFMPGGDMRNYLNDLVDRSASRVKNQTCNIAFVKTHKTASTTMATVLYRYGKRHGLNVANFEDHHSVIDLPEAARQVKEKGEPVDLMHYHHAWDGFYKGTWTEAKTTYQAIMRDPSNVKLVTVVREPVSHFLSYYYYFLQPDTGLSIKDYFEVAGNPKDPRHKSMKNKNKLTWHGSMVLHNPLCAEFGIRTPAQLEVFLRNDLPEFSMLLLTEEFEESLAIFMRMFNWEPIDMTYCRMIETKSGVHRYDGKVLVDVPKPKNLAPEVIARIRQQTNMDLILYNAAVRLYRQHKANYDRHLQVDVARIRQAQSAVHGYLDFDPKSDAHEWYEGDVKCFDDPSPLRNF